MPSPKSGKPGTLVAPAAPREALDADKADPGEAAKLKADQQQSGTGKYGATPVKTFSRKASGAGSSDPSGPKPDEAKKKPPHWIAIRLVDKEGEPMAGEAYRITLPDGQTVDEGTLDEKGQARIDGIDPGACKISFPNRDKTTWKRK